jgi:cell division protein FtsB
MAQNWVQHALDRSAWRPERQVAWLIILGIVITLIFAGVYLSQIANYATTNRQIEALIQQRDRLERENEALRADIAQLQTVPLLLQRAEVRGFHPATASDIE